MNKTLSIAAIAMVAVIMGMSALAPAMAAPKGNSGNADTEVCHFFAVYQTEIVDGVEVPILVDGEPVLDEALSAWGVLYVSSQGAAKGHTNHGDETITSVDEAGLCVSNNDGTITPP